MTRSLTLVLGAGLFFWALASCAQLPRACAQDAPPPTHYAPPPQVYWPPAVPPSPEEQERARRRAEKAAKQADRLQEHAQAQSLAAQHRAGHRVFTHFGFAPVMVARLIPNERPRERFRQQAFTLGAAYRRHFRPGLGLHAGGSVGVGASHLALTLEPGSECCYPSSERVSPSYSFDTEIAPLFGPIGRAFYLAPAWVTRVIIAPESSATITASGLSEDETRTVHFRSPIVTTGGRLGFGLMLGRHDEIDINFGLEAGYAARDATRYFGLFLRLGVAFSDLARRE
jgi:hypothetical protein